MKFLLISFLLIGCASSPPPGPNETILPTEIKKSPDYESMGIEELPIDFERDQKTKKRTRNEQKNKEIHPCPDLI